MSLMSIQLCLTVTIVNIITIAAAAVKFQKKIKYVSVAVLAID